MVRGYSQYTIVTQNLDMNCRNTTKFCPPCFRDSVEWDEAQEQLALDKVALNTATKMTSDEQGHYSFLLKIL